MIFPEGALNLTLEDIIDVHYTYKCTIGIDSVLLIDLTYSILLKNRWHKVRFLHVRRHLAYFYSAPTNVREAEETKTDHVALVPVPSTSGRPG